MEAAFKIITNPSTISAATRCVENAKTPIRRDVFAAAWHELLKRYLLRTPTASRGHVANSVQHEASCALIVSSA